MHEYVLVYFKLTYIIPAKHLLNRKYIIIMNHLFSLSTNFIIYIIGNNHIRFFAFYKAF